MNECVEAREDGHIDTVQLDTVQLDTIQLSPINLDLIEGASLETLQARNERALKRRAK